MSKQLLVKEKKITNRQNPIIRLPQKFIEGLRKKGAVVLIEYDESKVIVTEKK